MNLRRVTLISGTVVIVVAIVLVVAVWPREREPEYQGKKLSECMRFKGPGRQAYLIGVFSPLEPRSRIWAQPNPEGDGAVRQLGTNVIPCFVKWVRYERPRWTAKVAASYKRWPKVLRLAAVQSWLEYSNRERLADGMVAGFMSLGSDGTAAVPGLTEALQRTQNPETAERIVLCLASIGPGARQALPVLREATERDNGMHRESAALAVRAIEATTGTRVHVQYF